MDLAKKNRKEYRNTMATIALSVVFLGAMTHVAFAAPLLTPFEETSVYFSDTSSLPATPNFLYYWLADHQSPEQALISALEDFSLSTLISWVLHEFEMDGVMPPGWYDVLYTASQLVAEYGAGSAATEGGVAVALYNWFAAGIPWYLDWILPVFLGIAVTIAGL